MSGILRTLLPRYAPVNVQNAINASLFVQFVANNWQLQNGTNNNLDNAPVVNPSGAPVVLGKTYQVDKTIYACDLATDINPPARVKAGKPWVS